jgi:hypothetical protein
VLHGQVKASGRFATSAHAHQDHFCLLQISVGLAVVVGQ